MEIGNTPTQDIEKQLPHPKRARYMPGTTFMTRGKHPRECTVVDVLTTRNMAGEIVEIRYVSTHLFLGQTVVDQTACAVTIARGLIKEVAAEDNTAD